MVTARLRRSNWVRVGFTGLLLVVLLGILGLYTSINRNLHIWLPSPSEPVYGEDSRLLSIAQLPPVLNFMEADGVFVPGIISWRASHVRASLVVQEIEGKKGSAVPYDLDFHGEYQLILPDSRLNTVEVIFPFPSNLETLHNVEFLVDGVEPEGVEYSTGGIRWQDEFISNEEHTITIRYKAEGAHTFTYELPREQRSDIDVEVTVTGLTGSLFPDSSLPPIEVESGDEGETITWDYSNLIDNRNIMVQLPSEPTFPQRIIGIQGELGELVDHAPLIVGATLLGLAATYYLSEVRLKVESYLLLGLGLVLFFPLTTFLSGLIGLTAGSTISLLISIGLLMVFLMNTAGWEQVGWRTVLVLVVFLGAFGLGLLTEWSGLFLTFGSVVMLGFFMLLYARWQKAREATELIQSPEEIEEVEEIEEIAPEPVSESVISDQPSLHCPQCSHGLDEGVNFCPNCGYETKQILRCGNCGREQFPPPDFEVAYCLGCGEALG